MRVIFGVVVLVAFIGQMVLGAPMCECASKQDEQSCLLGHLIDVINKLINCQEKPKACLTLKDVQNVSSTTEWSTTSVWNATTSSKLTHAVHAGYESTTSTSSSPAVTEGTSTDMPKWTSPNTTASTTTSRKYSHYPKLSSTKATTETPSTSTETTTSEYCPANHTSSTVSSTTLATNPETTVDTCPASSETTTRNPDILLIPVMKVGDETKPVDLVQVLKCLFAREK
ncbi:integumentary mucin C.1-like [Photinus pyralis]|uniref:integumentary mucin C.1-like n=1 Tax=Photinus pyralis TaxID=7054 RepID=UPI001267135C|nr:integumentary mucin C.1-like [Photinus pyralis]